MLIDVILLLAAIILIAKGANWFVESAVVIAEAAHVPKAIIGATIVSIATTMPEIAVSFIAALRGNTEIAIGNVVGSVICNIGLAFGLVVAISSVPVSRQKLFLEQGFLMVIAGVVLLVMCLFGSISFFGGVFLLGLFCAYMAYSMLRAKGERRQGLEEYLGEIEAAGKIPARPGLATLKKEIIFFFIGAACVVGGSRLLVNSGVNIAHALHISERVIGLTLMAVGTSLPEVITCVTAAIKGHQDISFGNVIGANIIDITLAIGAAAMVRPLPIQQSARYLDQPAMLLLIVLMVLFGRTGNIFRRWEGLVLTGIYILYIALVFLI